MIVWALMIGIAVSDPNPDIAAAFEHEADCRQAERVIREAASKTARQDDWRLQVKCEKRDAQPVEP